MSLHAFTHVYSHIQDKLLARLQLDSVTGTWQAYVIANATTGKLQTVTDVTSGYTLAYQCAARMRASSSDHTPVYLRK
jgi:hypothetical protein